MINIKFDITLYEDKISDAGYGKVSNLVSQINNHLNIIINDAGAFTFHVDGEKYFVIFVENWLDAGSHTCFAWTSEDKNDVEGFLKALAKFPKIFCKVIPALPL